MCWPRLASARSGGDSRFFAALLLASVLGCVLFGSGRARAAERLLMVAVDVRGVDDATFRRFGVLALTRKIALRLTQSGFAVVAPERRPHVRVSLAPAGRRRVTLRAEARRV
ncbi:MAG: hypothetical protein KC503_47060, partial [Myxococcales bacterium]|nr:hypothetical protein [Myxococcales bacterium]